MDKRTRKIRRSQGYRKKTQKGPAPYGSSSRQVSLQEALALHQAGRLPEAEALYRQILLAEPDRPDALHYLGMLAHQVGRSEVAVELISKALKNKPDYVNAYNNLGIVLHDLGKLDEAVVSFRRALSLKPDYAEVHYNLGNGLKDLGRLDEAVASYRLALSLKPGYAEPYNNLGVIFHDLGKLDQAVNSFRQALRLKPDYTEAHYNLGNTFKDLGRLNEAVTSFRQVLSLKPDYADAYNNLGSILKDQGRLDEAVASFSQALTVKPDDAAMHYNLGVVFRELGKFDDAIACYKNALSLKSDYAAAFKDLASLVRYTEVDEEVRAMENLYNEKGAIPDADRIALGFALGKVFEDLEDFDKSFAFILEANRLKRESYDYSLQNDQDILKRIKKTFSPGYFASHLGCGHHDRTPIFIVGMPRSGTTLVEQILASHPLVFGAGELAILTDLTLRICPGGGAAEFPECVGDLDEETFDKMGLDYIGKIRKYSCDAQYITDKMPYNFLHVGLIRSILPDAKVVHCMRNPMDTCFSLFKNYFKEQHGFAYDMVELGRYYKLYQDLMAHWEKVLPGFMYTLRYEEMVSDQEKHTRNLLDFCGLPWDDACLAFHKTERRVETASLAQVRQPLYKGSVELWKRYEKQLEPLRKAIYGYK